MKRAIIAILCVLLLAGPAAAQEPVVHTLYLPTVSNMPTCQRPWRLIEPEATTNFVLNPSAEAAGSYVGINGGVVTRVTTYAHYGLYSYRVQTAANTEGIWLDLANLNAVAHYVTLRVRGTLPPDWRISLDNAHWHPPRLIEQINPDWALYGQVFAPSEIGLAGQMRIEQFGAGAGDFYVDGVQVEAKMYWTTYCDGTMDGCKWLGAPHAATSERGAQSRAGGRLRDFWDDYGFFVEQMVGVGAATSSLGVDSYALLPGGTLNSVKVEPRQFTLVGRFIADSEEELHRNRQALIAVLAHDAVPPDGGGWQPVRLWYSGAETEKQIAAHYDGGLEAKLDVSYGPYQVAGEDKWRKLAWWTEKTTVRFLAPDPSFYALGDGAAALDVIDDATLRIVAARLAETGQWDALGPPAVGGTYTQINGIAEDANFTYYVGDFLDFNNIGNADYVVRRNRQTGAWSALGTGLDGIAVGIVIGADGTVYIGGNFTDVGGGGGGTYNYIIAWHPATETWSALGVGMNNAVIALAIGRDGTLFAAGNFTTAGGGGAEHIAQWSAGAWSAVGAGLNSTAFALTVGLDGTIYVGGMFDDVWGGPGNTYNHIIAWDGANYSALGTGTNGVSVYALATAPDNRIFLGGNFTTAGGVTVNYVAVWNGTAFSALSGGVNNIVYGLEVGPDSVLYVAGAFTQAGTDLTITDYLAAWNGYSWVHVDLDLPGAAQVRALLASSPDPVINTKYDLWLGFSTSGSAYFSGLVAAGNDGTVVAHPIVIFERAGGSSPATVEWLKNERTGQIIWLDYNLLDGERLTLDLRPTQLSIISSFFGSVPDAVLAPSALSKFALSPGDNDITAFVNFDVVTYPTEITAYMLWETAYKSLD